MYLKKSRDAYKKLYSRSQIQTSIDTYLHTSNNSQEIFDYLIDPVTYTVSVYQKKEKEQRKKLESYMYCEQSGIIKDLLKCLI